jgi:amino acid adenylation domain-containing protein
MSHDAPLIASMLGAIKAGHAIVVLNPSDPPGRLDRIRRDVEPWTAVVDRRHRATARVAGFTQPLVVHDVPPAGTEPAQPPSIEPDDLAAVMYTSGSTGRPKGVTHRHSTLLHTSFRHARGLGLRPGDRVALLASPSGGHGMGTTWMTLLSGATLCPFPVMDRGVAPLPAWLREKRITVMGLSASLFRRLIRSVDGDPFPDLRLVRLGSEQVRRADFDACRRLLGEQCSFANVFSLTEAGGLAHCLIQPGEEPRPGPLPVGRPAEGIEIRLLDDRGNPVPPQQTGEIVVHSRHLSSGYWRDPDLTAERFSDVNGSGLRALRTGDLGTFDQDGRLVLVGRRDAQVKIRGYRVELSEVEAALASLPQVEAAAALAEPTRHGDARLTAYLVAGPNAHPAPAELRDALRATLSEASIPTAFAFVDELPLNAHGKIDRNRLADLAPIPAAAGSGSTPPDGELERELSGIWAEALELDRVGRDDDFFDLGGDSLTAAEIGAGVHGSFGVELDMRAFAAHTTVAEMAELVERLRDGGTPESPRIERVPRDGPLPCSFAQERIWRFMRAPGATGSYTNASVTALHDVDLEALRQALTGVVARHEPLRTTFVELEGRPHQIIHPASPLDIPLSDVSDADDPEEAALELLRTEAATPFDLERGPLVRFRLVRLAEGDHRILRVSQHLISDRHSWRIFFSELLTTYQAIRQGEPLPVTEDGPQSADFAVWERRRLRPDGPRYRQEVAWWQGALDRPPAPLRLPFARPAPDSEAVPGDGNIWWGMDPDVAGTLDRLGREEGATHYALRLALFSALLALETGRDEITLGAYVDTRRTPETRSMFGYFANLITLILPFDPKASLRHWVAKARYVLVEASAHGELPYERVCDELLASGRVPPEIKAIFSGRAPIPELPFGMTELIPQASGLVTMPWGFSFNVDQGVETERCQVAFDAQLYDPEGVREFVDRYAAMAEVAGARPDDPLGDLHAGLY